MLLSLGQRITWLQFGYQILSTNSKQESRRSVLHVRTCCVSPFRHGNGFYHRKILNLYIYPNFSLLTPDSTSLLNSPFKGFLCSNQCLPQGLFLLSREPAHCLFLWENSVQGELLLAVMQCLQQGSRGPEVAAFLGVSLLTGPAAPSPAPPSTITQRRVTASCS